MPEVNYNLATGVNKDTLLNVRLDTQERMRDLYENFNSPAYQPPRSFIPKHLSTDSLLGDKSISLPTLQEAIYSKDPRIADAAHKQIEYNAANGPRANGLGFERQIKYQPGQEKFTENHWWNEKAQTMYGFDPSKSIAENEDWIHHQVWDNYSTGGKIWRGVGTFAGRTLSKLVTGLVGVVGDLGAITWNGLQEVGDLANINDGTKNNFWNDVSNNWLSRQMASADEEFKKSWLPTYQTLDYDNKGAWAKLMDPHTWMNSFADGAGFLLQFAVPGAIFGKFAQAGKLARSIGVLEEAVVAAEATGDAAKIAKAAQNLKTAEAFMTVEKAKNVSGFTKLMGAEISDATRLGRRAGRVTEFFTGSKDVGGISAHIFNTSMESVAETKEGFDNTVRELMNNGMSREKAIEIAGENAPGQFWINMGILSASNAFENKLLQKAIGNRGFKPLNKLNAGTTLAEKETTTELGAFFKNNKWGQRIKYYGENAVKANIFEGWWEENAQTAATRWAKGDYIRKGDDTTSDGKLETVGSEGFWGLTGFWNQLKKQTIDSIKGNDREAADSIMAGAVIGVLGGTVMTKISGERKAILKNKAELVANFINTRDAWLSLDTLSADIYDKDGKIIPEKAKEKAEEINLKLEKIQSVFRRSITAEDLVDPHKREILQHRVFADYVKAHIMNKTADNLVERLRDWNDKPEGELSLYGVTPELKENAYQWANIAETLVDKWNNNIKDKKYNAPKDETVQSYQIKTQAIKSLIFDYTALKEMSKILSEKYKDLKDEYNPFSKFSEQQSYNEQHAKLLSLKALLNKVETPFEKEQVQNDIDELEKSQVEAKKNLIEAGDTKEDSTGFLFPKNVDPSKEFKDLSKVKEYLTFDWYQTSHEDAIKTYDKLIEDYSKEETGLQYYNDAVDFWSKSIENKGEELDKKVDEEERKNNLYALFDKVDELFIELTEAETEEEKKRIQNEIDEIEKEIKDLKDLQEEGDDIIEEDEEEEDEEDDPLKISKEPELGAPITSDALAIDTPFKTVNKETRNIKDKEDKIIYTQESVIENGYDHDLSEFIRQYNSKLEDDPNEYEAFVIKDTEELLKQRLSEKQIKEFEIDRAKLGAIVVFRKKGTKEWLKFEDREGKPIIAFSYNMYAFEDRIDERIVGKMRKTKMEADEVIAFYKQELETANRIRTAVIADENLIVPIKAIVGSTGVFPITSFFSNVFERFEGYYNKENLIEIVEDTNNYTDSFATGQLLLEIPKDKTDSKLPFYIPVSPSKLGDIKDTEVGKKIQQSIQAINNAKFDTKKEAKDIIQSYLKKLFYVSTKQYFKVEQADNKFKIVHYKKDNDDNEIETKRFVNLKLNLSKSLYQSDGIELLTIFSKDIKTNKFAPSKISVEEYRDFIHSSLETDRKLLLITRGNTKKVYTKKINAYFNLSELGESDVERNDLEESTETSLNTVINTVVSNKIIEIKKALKKLKEKSFEVDKDRNYYHEVGNEKEKWLRISTLKPNKFDGFAGDSANRGLIIDDLFRKFVDGRITTLDELVDSYEDNDLKSTVSDFNGDFLEDLFNIFIDIRNVADKQGITLISTIPTLWGTINKKRYAGTIDVLGIDKEGRVYIIDLKTSSHNRRDEKDKYHNRYKEDDSAQQSGYAELFRQRTGITIENIVIFPIQVTKKGDEHNSAIANKDKKGNFTMSVVKDRSIFPITETEIKTNDEIRNESYMKLAEKKNSTNKDKIEIAKELYKELKSGTGRQITQFTIEEQAILYEYATQEFRDTVDAELAALETPKEEKASENVNSLLEAKRKELIDVENAIKIGIDNAKSEGIKKILEDTGKKKIDGLKKEIEKLEKLEVKEEKPKTKLEELRTKVVFDSKIPEVPTTITFKIGRKQFGIDFNNGNFIKSPSFIESDIEKIKDFFNNGHAYSSLELNISGKNIYLVKSDKLGKFVILNEEFDSIPETKEMLKNKEYKNFKDCK